ncbi:hypothetical protein [Nocardiopsis alba]|uniref:hypothetical protein n=1 Tax=Nocardiopsis alba TaxID=53437 RepID=UPI0033A72EB5
MRKRTQLAERLESALRWAGMSDEAITELRGDEERTGPGWQRLAKAVVDNPYPGMDPKPNSKGKFKARTLREGEASRPAMNAGLKFALEGSSLKEASYRYEYFKAIFDSEKRNIDKKYDNEGKNPPNSEKIKEASEFTLDPKTDIQGKFEADFETAKDMRGGDPVYIDPRESQEKIISLVREQAERIGMGNPLSTIYHARKHIHELPEDERENEQEQHQNKGTVQGKENDRESRGESGTVKDYLNSLAKTLKEGEIAGFERTQDGQAVHLTFRRVVEQARGSTGTASVPEDPTGRDEEKKTTLIGHLYIRDHTGAQVATYGRGSKNDRELE